MVGLPTINLRTKVNCGLGLQTRSRVLKTWASKLESAIPQFQPLLQFNTKFKGVMPTGITFFFGDHTAWWKHLFPFRTQ
jgi:hypothetical protein